MSIDAGRIAGEGRVSALLPHSPHHPAFPGFSFVFSSTSSFYPRSPSLFGLATRQKHPANVMIGAASARSATRSNGRTVPGTLRENPGQYRSPAQRCVRRCHRTAGRSLWRPALLDPESSHGGEAGGRSLRRGSRLVPIFWLATTITILRKSITRASRSGRVCTISIATASRGLDDAPVGTVTFGPEIEAAVKSAIDLLGPSRPSIFCASITGPARLSATRSLAFSPACSLTSV